MKADRERDRKGEKKRGVGGEVEKRPF